MRTAFGFGFGVGVWGFGVGVRVEIERLFSVALGLSRHGPGDGDRFGGSLSMVEPSMVEPTQFPVQFGSAATAAGTLHEYMYGAVHEARGRDMQAKVARRPRNWIPQGQRPRILWLCGVRCRYRDCLRCLLTL